MKFEISQKFYFEAAHTLDREIDQEGSRRIHGHTYHAQIFMRGDKDPKSNMIIDLGQLNAEIADVREQLDHRFLDEVPGLGVATLENLCVFIHEKISAKLPNVVKVGVARMASGDRCELLVD